MKLLVVLLLSPAVICAQLQRKSSNPNDEPFLPIHPEYPYSPKLMKRGLEHSQQHQHQQLQQQQQQSQTLSQTLGQLTPELYAPKVDARDSYSSSYGPSSYLSSLEPYKSATAAQSSLATSPYSSLSSLSSSLSSYGASPLSSLLSSYGSPYGSPSAAAALGLGAPPAPYGAPGVAGAPSLYGAASGAYPNYFYPPAHQAPYYYPNYYGQAGYPGAGPYGPAGPYPGAPYSKHPHDDEDEDEDDRRRDKPKRPHHTHKNRLRNSDRDSHYVDGANYIISSAKDLDGESSTHRTPSHLNQIDDSEVSTRPVIIPKATYRLVSLSSGQQQQQQQPNIDPNPHGYIKIQQLEQLMRQALTKLLAQNAIQQANLVAIQQEANQQQYLAAPSASGIAKTGLSYVINPTVLNRVNAPSQLIQPKKPTTTVSLQQSPGIYIPPTAKGANDQSSNDYADYDGPEVGATPRSQSTITNYQSTAEPSQARSSYPYSTYRPTQQTSLDDVNFGSKKSKS